MKTENDVVGLFVVFALVMILGLFGWISERDYEYQQEIVSLHQALLATESECSSVMEMSMPVALERVQL